MQARKKRKEKTALFSVIEEKPMVHLSLQLTFGISQCKRGRGGGGVTSLPTHLTAPQIKQHTRRSRGQHHAS